MAKLALLAQFGAAVFCSLASRSCFLFPHCGTVSILSLMSNSLSSLPVVFLLPKNKDMTQWFRFRTRVLKWHSVLSGKLSLKQWFRFRTPVHKWHNSLPPGSLPRAHYARSRTRFGFPLLQLLTSLKSSVARRTSRSRRYGIPSVARRTSRSRRYGIPC